MLLIQRQEKIMKNSKRSVRSKSSKSIPSATVAAVTGGTGLAILGAAAIGVAGFFAYRNRDSILNFIGKYVDLPDSLKPSEESESWDSSKKGSVLTTDSYKSPSTTEHRM
jgi:hypothetical protein